MTVVAAPEIMIVDDDPHVREALTDFLGDEGFRVRDAVNGADALAQLAVSRARPALMILDLAMPVMDGFELLRQLSADDKGAAPFPILIFSATLIGDNGEGFPDHIIKLRKPTDVQSLIGAIRGILGTEYPVQTISS